MRLWMLGLVTATAAAAVLAAPAAADFPPADSGYHSYAEVSDESAQIAARYPSLVQRFSIGKSYEGREIWALKISDNVALDEPEPEALFDASQHAREHLTVETAMYLVNELASQYASDARIRAIVDSREIWIVPNTNPDGAEYDIESGTGYRRWRKNRQPTANGIGTDLNRNWGFQWGCCDGSSSDPTDDVFRGASAFSAPETRAVRDLVLSRRVGGVQQIKVAIDFHSYGELVMWPFAYTESDTAPGMSQDQRDAFAALGQSMAQSNGYKPQQASDLYISDGNMRDWLWGSEGIFAYGFEIYPSESSVGLGGFYPPDEIIPAQTARNREAVLRLLEIADCPYRATGKESQYCGTDPGDGGSPGGTPPPPPPPPPPAPPLVPPPPQPVASSDGDGGANGGAGDAGPAAGAGERATATIVPDRAALDARGNVRLRVRCGAVATRCRGTLKLAARLPGARRIATIAKTNYVMTPGTEAIRLRLGPTSRAKLRRRTAITVTATITSYQEATGETTTATRRVKLVRPKTARK